MTFQWQEIQKADLFGAGRLRRNHFVTRQVVPHVMSWLTRVINTQFTLNNLHRHAIIFNATWSIR